jgi:metal transporter CNNM
MPLLMSLAKLASATPVLIFQNTHAVAPIEPEDPVGSTRFYFKLGFSVCLVLAGGVFAGCVTVACAVASQKLTRCYCAREVG